MNNQDVDNEENIKPKAFFASRMALPNLQTLRKDIYEIGNEGQIWVSEYSTPQLSDKNDLIFDEAEIYCLKMIRNTENFICVLDGTYGSTGWSKEWSQNDVSILELELFMAALERKQMSIFLLKPFDNIDPRLNSLLQIIENVCPEALNKTPKSIDEIKKEINHSLKSNFRKDNYTRIEKLNKIIGNFIQFLARIRSLRVQNRNSNYKDVYFLNGEFTPFINAPPDKNLIIQLLENVNSTSHSPTKLAKLWIAVRYLSSAYFEDPKYLNDYLPLWDSVMSHWSSASAWYGLHGHLYLGRLAAVNTLLKIKQVAKLENNPFSQLHPIHGTYGAVASEYYSIAKMVPTRQDKKALLKIALNNVNQAISLQDDPSGFLAVRGSIYLALGNVKNAVYDYETELQKRINSGKNTGEIGEAEVELGMAYFHLGKISRARELLETGISDLKHSNRPPFLVRALRKACFFYAYTFQKQKALSTLKEAIHIAKENELQGQLGQMKNLPLTIKLLLGGKNIDKFLTSEKN